MVDLDRQCGVLLENGMACPRSLTCKAHTMTAKRAVVGRSRPFDELRERVAQGIASPRPGDMTRTNSDLSAAARSSPGPAPPPTPPAAGSGPPLSGAAAAAKERRIASEAAAAAAAAAAVAAAAQRKIPTASATAKRLASSTDVVMVSVLRGLE